MAPCLNQFKLMQTISFLYVLVTVTCTESLLSHHDECLALFQFKQSFFHDEEYASFDPRAFPKLASWKLKNNASDSSSDCCLWDGVACRDEEEEGHVISLDLSRSFLRDPINSSSTLFSLVHLQRLNLSMNNFAESQILSRIGCLKKLRSLNLRDSGFGGQIPNEISQLMQLDSLDLSLNPLKLQSPSLEKLVKKLTGLEVLDLSGVNTSFSVPAFLAKFSSLRVIHLENCLLQDEFPTAIFHLPKLNFFGVGNNTNLTGVLPEFRNDSLLEHLEVGLTSFSGNVPESIGNLKYLITLILEDCSFSGRFPGSLSNLTRLTYLSIGYNDFTGLVPSLVSLSEISVLSIGENKFEKLQLPDWLCKLTKLTQLYVSGMNIYGEIPTFLVNLKQFLIVEMSENSLVGRIPSLFFNLTHLRIVDLGSNQLQGPISSSFAHFKYLWYLRLNRKKFSGRVDLDMFVGLDKLKTLLVGNNKISFMATNYTNGTLPELKTLGLASCNLKESMHFYTSNIN